MGSRLNESSSAVRKRIQNHSFEDEEGEEYGESRFGGFGDYFRRKKAKLQNLDYEIRTSSIGESCPPIFNSVVAHVNGYTQPSLQDLHRLIVRHGGGFLQYLDGKTAATHIIASSLTPKKREEFRRYRVVKPAWVVESVNAGRLLPWDMFRVVDEGQSQKILTFDNGRMASQTNAPQTSYKNQSSPGLQMPQLSAARVAHTNETFPVKSRRSSEISLSEASQSDYGDFPSFTSLGEAAKGVASHTSQVNQTQGTTASILHDTNLRTMRTPSPDGQAHVADIPRPTLHEPSGPNMTSEEYNAQLLSDPRMRNSSGVNSDFIQQYYKESRLHHLSTWKAELKAQLQAKTREKSMSHQRRKTHTLGARQYIMHIDFDCFFAAVSILKHPELAEKPVAIAHGTGAGSEIASCNYPARTRGVKNGMWMKTALQSCPELHVLPYDFPAYEDASRKFYRAILSIDGVAQSVSIDEALVDITSICLEAGGTNGTGVSEGSIYREQAKADEIGETLRALVKSETGCAVSVGIGGNILLAKIALRKAKPAGQFHLKPDSVLDTIANLPVQSLPGVGYSLASRLEELGVKFVKDIRDVSRERLASTLGPKTGARLWDYARGIDRSEVGNEVIRKSVSAEVNWGIRFVNQTQAEDFVRSLCEELHRRLAENLVKGKQLTLKVMRRSPDAPLEPVKHMGHGQCDIFNKSVGLGVATNAAETLGKEAITMLRALGITPGDLRGIGVQMTKLEPLKSAGPEKLDSSQQQLVFKTTTTRKALPQALEPTEDPDIIDSPRKGETETINHGPSLSDSSNRPLNIMGTQFIMPSQPDPKVVAELPNDIRSKLISQGRLRRDSRAGSPSPAPRPHSTVTALPPQSQLDPDTLAALPEDLRAEILGYYNEQPALIVPPPTPPTNPAPRPSSSSGLKVRKPTTPTKKRRGRPSSKVSNPGPLAQSKFVFKNPDIDTTNPHGSRPPSRQTSPSEETGSISAEFLAALPEDIRLEVLADHRASRLLKRSSTNISNPTAVSTSTATSSSPFSNTTPNQHKSVAQERLLRLPPLPERPTFTANKLTNLPDLRDAISTWYTSFADEGPFDEDVKSLAKYLYRVVVEEKDIDKAVSVTKWLIWLVRDGKTEAPHQNSLARLHGGLTWDDAVELVKVSVQDGVEARGLPDVEF